jgi:hypothetical protein
VSELLRTCVIFPWVCWGLEHGVLGRRGWDWELGRGDDRRDLGVRENGGGRRLRGFGRHGRFLLGSIRVLKQ